MYRYRYIWGLLLIFLQRIQINFNFKQFGLSKPTWFKILFFLLSGCSCVLCNLRGRRETWCNLKFWDRLHLTPGALGGGPWLNNSFLLFPWMFWWGGQSWALPPRAGNLSLSEAWSAGRCLALWSERATSCGDMENCWVLLWGRGFFLCNSKWWKKPTWY